MSLLSDCLLAVTGLKPKNIGPRELADAALLTNKIQKKMSAWLTSEQDGFNFFEVPDDIDKWLDDLIAPVSEEDVARWIEETGDPTLIAEYVIGLRRARDHLVAAWPRVIEDTFAGPRPYPLSPEDAAEVWSLISVADEFSRFMAKVADYTLTQEEVSALRGCLPELYVFLAGSPALPMGVIQQAIMERVAKEPHWEPSAEQDSVLHTLLGLPPEAPLPPPPPKPEPPKKFEVDSTAAATQADLTATPKIASKKR